MRSLWTAAAGRVPLQVLRVSAAFAALGPGGPCGDHRGLRAARFGREASRRPLSSRSVTQGDRSGAAQPHSADRVPIRPTCASAAGWERIEIRPDSHVAKSAGDGSAHRAFGCVWNRPSGPDGSPDSRSSARSPSACLSTRSDVRVRTSLLEAPPKRSMTTVSSSQKPASQPPHSRESRPVFQKAHLSRRRRGAPPGARRQRWPYTRSLCYSGASTLLRPLSRIPHPFASVA